MDDTLKNLRTLQQDGENETVIQLIEKEKQTPHRDLLKNIALIFMGTVENPQEHLSHFLLIETEDKDFLSDIALAAILCGELEKAWSILSLLIEENRADAVVYGRAAAVAVTKGELSLAKKYYKEAVNRESGRAQWHNNLAGIYVREQKLQEALEHYNIALKLKNDFTQAKESKTKVLVALQKIDEVIEQLELELAENKEDYRLCIRLSRVYMLDNRLQKAVKNINENLLKVEDINIVHEDKESEGTEEEKEIYTAQVTYRVALAEMFMEKERWFKALLALEELEKLEIKNMLFIYLNRLHIYVELNKFDKAEAVLQIAQKEYKDDNYLQMAEATMLCEKGEYARAESIQRALLKTYPADAQLKSALGQTLLWIGKIDEAGKLFKEASELNPMALAQMVNAKKYPTDRDSIELMRNMVDNLLLDKKLRETMGFAVSEVYEKEKKYDDAFKYLKIANDLVDSGIEYKTEFFTQKIDQIIKIFSKEFMDSLAVIRTTDRIPIFIVGMPRSGTTLLEQILCSHKDIFGAGELDSIARLTTLMPKVLKMKQHYPEIMSKMTPHLREEAARFYINALEPYDSEHKYIVDKMPHNFQHVGLIHAILPAAKIIHMQRDPRDNAVSNYQQNFKAKNGGLGYSFNLEKIAKQINDYNRVMQHWRDIGVPMFEVTYEELVTNTDNLSREILEFVGVGYDENIKNFHKTERAVRTASVSQVRQPIYQTAKQKWKRYEKYLTPLLENLHPDILKQWEQK